MFMMPKWTMLVVDSQDVMLNRVMRTLVIRIRSEIGDQNQRVDERHKDQALQVWMMITGQIKELRMISSMKPWMNLMHISTLVEMERVRALKMLMTHKQDPVNRMRQRVKIYPSQFRLTSWKLSRESHRRWTWIRKSHVHHVMVQDQSLVLIQVHVLNVVVEVSQ